MKGKIKRLFDFLYKVLRVKTDQDKKLVVLVVSILALWIGIMFWWVSVPLLIIYFLIRK